MNIKIDINICRVCLQSYSGQSLFGESTQYAKKFTYTTQLKATKGDGLPELLCAKCVARLKIAYEFRKQSEASEQHLRKFIAALNAKEGAGADDADAADDDLEARLLAEAYADGEPDEPPTEQAAPKQQQQQQKHQKVEQPEDEVEEEDDDDAIAVSAAVTPPPLVVKRERKETRQSAAAAAAAAAAANVTASPVRVQPSQPQPQRTSARNAHKQLIRPKAEPLQLQPVIVQVASADAMPPAPPTIEEVESADDSFQIQIIHEPFAASAKRKRYAGNTDDDNDDDDADHDGNTDGLEVVQEFIIDDHQVLVPGDDGYDEQQDDGVADPDVDEADMKEEHLLDDELDLAGDEEDALQDYDDDDLKTIDPYLDDNDAYSIGEQSRTTSAAPARPAPAKKRRRTALGSSAASLAGASSVGGVHVCQQCNKDFSTRTNLLRHIQTHDGSKPYKCTLCDSAFTQNSSLNQHMHIHTGERPFTCEFCGRGFTQSKSLTFHMRRHTGEKPFTCPHCSLSFRQKDGLKRHTAVRHPAGEKLEFTCDICHKVLRSRYSLNVHKRRHCAQPAGREDDEAGGGGGVATTAAAGSATKPAAGAAAGGAVVMFQCEQCPRAFVTQASLVAHRRQHTSEREAAKCPQCDAVVGSRVALQTHMRTVHREGVMEGDIDLEPEMPKPFECKECGLRFVQEAHRAVHVRNVHSKRCKRFQCERCSKGYAIKANLDAHMARHESNGLLEHSFEHAGSVKQLDEEEEFEEEEYAIEEDADDGGGDDEQQQQQQQQQEHEIVTGDAESKPIFECGSCNIGYTNAQALVQHGRDEHGIVDEEEDEEEEDAEMAEAAADGGDVDESYMCETCEQVFGNLGDMEAHILLAHTDRQVEAMDVLEAPSAEAAAAAEEEVATTTTTKATANESVVLFKCDRCGDQLKSQKALDEHGLEHDLTDGK